METEAPCHAEAPCQTEGRPADGSTAINANRLFGLRRQWKCNRMFPGLPLRRLFASDVTDGFGPASFAWKMIRYTLRISLLLAISTFVCSALSSRAVFGNDVEFAIEVMSVLSKSGCNAGTCHGNLNGKGGFKLSLRGQDPEFDFRALCFESRGRRVSRSAPEQSLFVRKAIGAVPHRGGIRFSTESQEYELLMRWLRSGAPGPSPKAAEVTRLDVEPSQAIVVEPVGEVRFRVQAHFSDGTSRDVTDLACYELSNLNAAVDATGVVSRVKYGEVTLIVRYLQQQVPVPIAFTEQRPNYRWQDPPVNNEVDRHVFAKLQRLRINPSDLCDDSTFVRRAYLDAIGRLPTAEEAKDFVAKEDAGKRAELIDELLSRNEFADFWALKWADVLRTEEKVLDTKGVEVFHAWIRESIAAGRPLDQFVRDLVTGVGSTFEHPPANYYRANRDPATRGETTARLFLGTRLQCAKCHNHPFDRWTQDDYYQWASLFSQIDYKIGEEDQRRDKLDKNEFAGDQVVLVAKQDEVRNPDTGEIATPRFLGGDELSASMAEDRLAVVANWLTSPDNALFAKSQTNFIWYHLMGTGLVDPIDDFRLTNPPSNPELLDYLAGQLVGSGFDIRSLIREIMNSRTYQLSSEPNDSNRNDLTSYSHATVRRLPAEVILDMQSDVLDIPAAFLGYPVGMRAVQIPGVHRKRVRDATPQLGDRFLKTFGKPERILACECERSNETTLKQVFVLMGDGLNERLADPNNRLHRLAMSDQSDAAVIDELYWTALSRGPTDAELAAALEVIQQAGEERTSFQQIGKAVLTLFAQTGGKGGPPPSIESIHGRASRGKALEDIAWALLNAKEFLFRK